MKKFKLCIDYLLMSFGGLFLGLMAHELYHALTKVTVDRICLEFGSERIAFVSGIGESSEIIAYGIMILISVLVAIYAYKRLC